MKKTWFIIALIGCLLLGACQKAPEKPAHQHTFGDWVLQERSTCVKEGRENRRCSECGFTESRSIEKLAHRVDAYNICKDCMRIEFDDSADFVELGVVCNNWYGGGDTATTAWDVKVWNGKVYRGAGDYGENSGVTKILAYNIGQKTWEVAGVANDEAIHRFVEINGTLYSPGIDPTGNWSSGNYYVLDENGKFQLHRTLPNGVHCFDMIEFDGKVFAGLGTEKKSKTIAFAPVGSEDFQFVPLYKDGKVFPTSSYSWTRTYDFVEYNGSLYALVSLQMGIGSRYVVFRYEDGKMVYQAEAGSLISGISTGRNYWEGDFQFNGACYLTANHLYAITDFSNPDTWKKIEMPNQEQVCDAFLRDGVIYVLANKQTTKNGVRNHHAVVYKSTTGQEGSFEEILSFDYPVMPCAFDWDGQYFYIGMGSYGSAEKGGMLLRVKPT